MEIFLIAISFISLAISAYFAGKGHGFKEGCDCYMKILYDELIKQNKIALLLQKEKENLEQQINQGNHHV